jgi:Flp pilus assembly protein TadG
MMMRGQRSDCKNRPQSGGAVLVELALLLPLLLFLTLASVEFSQAIAAYKVIVNQVRSAARHLSTKAPGTGHTEAECLLTHGNPSSAKPCIGSVLLPGFSVSGFSVTVSDAVNAPTTHRSQRTTADLTVTNASTLNLVTVTASGYQHPLYFAGFLSGVVGNASSLTFGPISMTMRQIN